MNDPNLITQLAEALPEGAQVPGWRFDLCHAAPHWYGHDADGFRYLGTAGDLDLAAFTYAAEETLLAMGCYMEPIGSNDGPPTRLRWVMGRFAAIPQAMFPPAPTRPAAALAALRAMKEEK